MKIVERVFVSRPDINKIHESLRNQQAAAVVCYTLVESFIKSFEKSKEVVQLFSIVEISEDEKFPNFYKAVHNVDEGFNNVAGPVEISEEEYYDKLLSYPPSFMAVKMRVCFNLKGIDYTLDYTPDDSYSVLRIRYKSETGDEDPSMLTFGALPLGAELDLTFEETSYRFSENKNILEKI